MDEDDIPPPVPPRHPNMLAETIHDDLVTQSLGGYRMQNNLVRSGSEHCLLSQSTIEPSGLKSHRQQQQFSGSTSPLASLRRGSLTPISRHSAKEKKPKSEKNPFKTKKNKKKSDTFGGRGTPTGSVLSSPARNATMFFGGSPSHTVNLSSSVNLGGGGGGGASTRGSLSCSASFNSADIKSSKKSRWGMIRHKVGKKLTRTPNMLDDEEPKIQGRGPRTQRSHSSPSIKKYSVGRSLSITEEDGRGVSLPDGGTGMSISGAVSPRLRRGSSSQQGYNLKMLSKIFAILTCWLEEYFEVS